MSGTWERRDASRRAASTLHSLTDSLKAWLVDPTVDKPTAPHVQYDITRRQPLSERFKLLDEWLQPSPISAPAPPVPRVQARGSATQTTPSLERTLATRSSPPTLSRPDPTPPPRSVRFAPTRKLARLSSLHLAPTVAGSPYRIGTASLAIGCPESPHLGGQLVLSCPETAFRFTFSGDGEHVSAHELEALSPPFATFTWQDLETNSQRSTARFRREAVRAYRLVHKACELIASKTPLVSIYDNFPTRPYGRDEPCSLRCKITVYADSSWSISHRLSGVDSGSDRALLHAGTVKLAAATFETDGPVTLTYTVPSYPDTSVTTSFQTGERIELVLQRVRSAFQAAAASPVSDSVASALEAMLRIVLERDDQAEPPNVNLVRLEVWVNKMRTLVRERATLEKGYSSEQTLIDEIEALITPSPPHARFRQSESVLRTTQEREHRMLDGLGQVTRTRFKHAVEYRVAFCDDDEITIEVESSRVGNTIRVKRKRTTYELGTDEIPHSVRVRVKLATELIALF
ncbi:uncharacterized protein JCM15063_001662 [Sporobolomyces koalae]|uniref:uncharacterized protein n=1 Tax=Sporobolomyces koalae TaxID=500713 RepID=UPI00316B9514